MSSTRTNAILTFGVDVGAEEEHDIPWANVDNPEDWWLRETGFDAFDPYDEYGQFKPGLEREQVDAYYRQREAWLREHPMPVELTPHCSDVTTMWIVAVKGAEFIARRGYLGPIEQELRESDPSFGGYCMLSGAAKRVVFHAAGQLGLNGAWFDRIWKFEEDIWSEAIEAAAELGL